MGLVDRLLRGTWQLVVLLLVLAMVLPMALRAAALVVAGLVEVLVGTFGHSMLGPVWLFLFLVFTVGVGVRVLEGLRGRTSPGSRENEARRTRLAVRRRAEDVPLGINPPELAEDPDPPVPGSGR